MLLYGFNLIRQILGAVAQTEVVYTDNSLEFGKSCEDSSRNHRFSTLHRAETNGIAERAVRRVKEGTSAVLLQSGLNERWWSDSMECYCYLRHVQNLLGDRKTTHERRFGEPLKRPTIPFGVLIKYHPISPKDQSRIHHFGKKVFPEDVLIAELEDLENWMHQTFYPQKIEAKEKLIRHKRMMNSYSHLQMAQQNCQEETTNSERLNQP